MFQAPTLNVFQDFENDTLAIKKTTKFFEEDRILQKFCSPLLTALQGFYDSLPAPNSRSSLPVSFINSVPQIVHFPNQPSSYYLHHTAYSKSRIKASLNSTPYQKYLIELENSIAPYGFEYEQCFNKEGKEQQLIPLGKTKYSFIRDFEKCTINVFQHLDVKLNKKNNKLIIKSKFLNNTKIVYFKESSKIAFFIKDKNNSDKIIYNPFQPIPSNMINHISKHIKIKNTLAAQTILQLNDYRDVYLSDIKSLVHNPFYLQSQCLHLLPSLYSGFQKKQRKVDYNKAVRNEFKYYYNFFKTSQIPERYWKILSNYFPNKNLLGQFISIYSSANCTIKEMLMLFFDLQKQHYFQPRTALALFHIFSNFTNLEQFIKNIDNTVSLQLDTYDSNTFNCKTIKEFKYELDKNNCQYYLKVSDIAGYEVYKRSNLSDNLYFLKNTVTGYLPLHVVLENYKHFHQLYHEHNTS